MSHGSSRLSTAAIRATRMPHICYIYVIRRRLLLACLAHANAPHLRPLLHILPQQLPLVLGDELIVERFGVMIVDEEETAAQRQRVETPEDDRMAPRGWQVPHIEHVRLLTAMRCRALSLL